MLDEHVELLEQVVIEQKLDALARGQLALGVLGRDALLATPQPGAVSAGVEAGEDVFHGRALLRAKSAREVALAWRAAS